MAKSNKNKLTIPDYVSSYITEDSLLTIPSVIETVSSVPGVEITEIVFPVPDVTEPTINRHNPFLNPDSEQPINIPDSKSDVNEGSSDSIERHNPFLDGSEVVPEGRPDYNPDGFNDGHVPTSPDSDSGFFDKYNPVGQIEQMVTSSTAYQDAYSLFSSDKKYGSIFLIRLEAIPTSVIEADKTFWDRIGLSNNYEDVVRASYQRCMEAISNLVSEYQQYINSLPITQVQQFSDAGINSAITGQGVSGSSLNPSSPQTDPSQLSSTNSGSYISAIANLLASTIPSSVSQFLTVFNEVRKTKDSRSNTLANLWKSLSDSGYAMEGVSFNDWSDVENFQKNFSVTSSKAENRKLTDAINNFKLSMTSKVADYFTANLDDVAHDRGMTIDDLYNEIAQSAIDEWVYDRQCQAELFKYQYKLRSSLDPEDEKSAIVAENKYRKVSADFEAYKIDLRTKKINSWLDRIKNTNDPVVKQAFVQYLMSVDDTYAGKVGGFLKDTLSGAIGAFVGARAGRGASSASSTSIPFDPYSTSSTL